MARCVAVSAQEWRDSAKTWDDERCAKELERAWEGRYHRDPSRGRIYHDWTDFRAVTLREARRRGLDLSAAELGT